MTPLPRALTPFLRFAQALRRAGFAISPDQTVHFIEGVGLLGPRDLTDVYRAGRAIFGVQPERVAEYDALFRTIFFDQTLRAPASSDSDDDELEAHEPGTTQTEVEAQDDQGEIGAEATANERLTRRPLMLADEQAALARLRRQAATDLPRRLTYRRAAAKRGDRIDLRRSLRETARRDGDVMQLYQTRRKTRQRRVLVLIDVSGSMKDRTDDLMRLAHAVVQAADRAEVFTFGTRLTRVTTALRPADTGRAMTRAAEAIADIDGGTRIGEALHAYLSVPRYAVFARGAAVIIISDGLERGAPELMISAVDKLTRVAWRLDWLTPLAADTGYRPMTAGLQAVMPMLDHLGSAASTVAVVDHILTMAARP